MARNSYLIVNEDLISRLLQGCDLQCKFVARRIA